VTRTTAATATPTQKPILRHRGRIVAAMRHVLLGSME
jgi:hypothetical protein